MRRLIAAIASIGGAQAVYVALGMVGVKILAVVLGAAGTGFYSLLRQIHDLLTGWAALGGGNALIQGLSARQGEARARLLGTGLWLCAFGVLCGLVLVMSAPQWLARVLFDSADPGVGEAVRWIGATMTLAVIGNFLIAQINARRGFTLVAVAQIAGSLAMAAIAWPIAKAAIGAQGRLIWLIALPILVQLAVLVVMARFVGVLEDLKAAWRRWDSPSARHFAIFIGYGIVQLAAASASGIFIRALIVHSEGLEAAGYFQAAWTLGMQNFTLLLAPFAAYVLPTLAALQQKPDEYRQAWHDMATVLIAGAIPFVVASLAFKPLLLRLFFTRDFLAAVPTLEWMLLGNLARALSWLLAIHFMVSARLWIFLGMELVWYALFTLGAVVAIEHYGQLPLVGVAFCVAYLAYAALSLALCWRHYRLMLTMRHWLVTGLGAALIVATALLNWNAVKVDWLTAIPAVAVACLLGLAAFNRSRRAAMFAAVTQRGRRP